VTHFGEQQYLELLEQPAIIQAVQDMYFGVSLSAHALSRTRENVNRSAPVANTEQAPEDQSTLYPMIQPMKAAELFDSATGLGQWQVLMSGRAVRYLQQAYRKDQHIFEIVKKKILYVLGIGRR
jgi:hypothetical protein